jgi:hypothetical protein
MAFHADRRLAQRARAPFVMDSFPADPRARDASREQGAAVVCDLTSFLDTA